MPLAEAGDSTTRARKPPDTKPAQDTADAETEMKDGQEAGRIV